MAHAGLRLGEALVMRREYFDAGRKTFTVCQSYKRHTFKKPKGGKTRVVDLPDYLVEEMDDYIRYLKKDGFKTGRGGEVDLLFEGPEELVEPYPLSQRKVQRLVHWVCAAGLRVRNPHDLRHTYPYRSSRISRARYLSYIISAVSMALVSPAAIKSA